MANLQSASLVLNTVYATFNNEKGSSVTWHNVDLRMILGDMYDKYDLFNLNLSGIYQAFRGNFILDDSNNMCNVRISGLPFVNATTVVGLDGTSQTNYATIAGYQFKDNTQAVLNYNGFNSITFSKNQSLCSITIDVIKISTMLPFDAGTDDFASVSYQFNIYGVESSKQSDVKRRI